MTMTIPIIHANMKKENCYVGKHMTHVYLFKYTGTSQSSYIQDNCVYASTGNFRDNTID